MFLSARTLVPLLFFGGVLYSLIFFREALLPFLLAATVAYVLNPAVAFIQIRGIRRERAVAVVYSLVLILFVSFTYLAITAVMQSATNMTEEMPEYVRKGQQFVDRLDSYPILERSGLSDWIQDQVAHGGPTWMLRFIEEVPALIHHHLLPLIELAFLVPLLTFFFMKDGPTFLEHLLEFVPSRRVEMLLNVIVEIHHSFGNYLRGLLLQSFFMGVLTGIGYGLIGLDYVVYIAFWAAISSMIPFLGPISAALAAGIVALFQWGTVGGMLRVVGVFVIIRTIDDWMLNPIIMRRAVQIHPMVSIFALIAGAYTAGLWGLLFAVPAVCMAKVLLEVGWQWYSTEYGLHRKPVPPEAAEIPLV